MNSSYSLECMKSRNHVNLYNLFLNSVNISWSIFENFRISRSVLVITFIHHILISTYIYDVLSCMTKDGVIGTSGGNRHICTLHFKLVFLLFIVKLCINPSSLSSFVTKILVLILPFVSSVGKRKKVHHSSSMKMSTGCFSTLQPIYMWQNYPRNKGLFSTPFTFISKFIKSEENYF